MLAKLVTWMRRQSGTTDLRVLLYMDEVAGYLPPTANPPTKKPIMLLMKQARAFGVGVVLATQNPVDVDYKALSNAGTWMIGRLQTDRDKQRLLDGMSAAAGGVDVALVGDTISGLAKREFVLRRAGKDRPEVFTTRWAMSYLRGPMTRDQIKQLTPEVAPDSAGVGCRPRRRTPLRRRPPHPLPTTPTSRRSCRRSAAASPCAGSIPPHRGSTSVGAEPGETTHAAALVARVALRYDDAKADLVHDEEYEAVLFPLVSHVDVTTAVAVDYDDRDLRDAAPAACRYRLTDAPIAKASFWKGVQRDLVDHLTRSRTLEIPTNPELKLYGRPGESVEDFTARCLQVADERADAELAKLRDKYEAKATTLRNQIEAASDAATVAEDQHRARARDDLLSSAGSILGGLLGGRRSRGGLLGQLGRAAGRGGKTSAAASRVEAAKNKVARFEADLEALEAELAEELTEIDTRWMGLAEQVASMPVTLERTDVKVTNLTLAWVPSRGLTDAVRSTSCVIAADPSADRTAMLSPRRGGEPRAGRRSPTGRRHGN